MTTTTTTNYGWTIPNDSELVKDGAAAIRTLGNAADASLKTVSDAAIAKTIVDAKGDIIAATAADTVARLAVGTDGQVLTADAASTAGIKWATSSSGGMTQLATGTLSGANVNIASISQSYKDLVLVLDNAYVTGSTGYISVRPNNFSGSQEQLVIRSTATAVDNSTNNYAIGGRHGSSATSYTGSVVTFYNYTSTTNYKLIQANFNNGAQAHFAQNTAGTNSAVTSIDIYSTNGNWGGGTYTLYGVK